MRPQITTRVLPLVGEMKRPAFRRLASGLERCVTRERDSSSLLLAGCNNHLVIADGKRPAARGGTPVLPITERRDGRAADRVSPRGEEAGVDRTRQQRNGQSLPRWHGHPPADSQPRQVPPPATTSASTGATSSEGPVARRRTGCQLPRSGQARRAAGCTPAVPLTPGANTIRCSRNDGFAASL